MILKDRCSTSLVKLLCILCLSWWSLLFTGPTFRKEKVSKICSGPNNSSPLSAGIKEGQTVWETLTEVIKDIFNTIHKEKILLDLHIIHII